MKLAENMLHAKLVTCPSCHTELELDQTESENQRFTCPECGAGVDISEPPVSNATREMIQEGKIHISFWDRIDLLLYPTLIVFIGFLMLSIGFQHSILDLAPIFFIGFGLFHAYRAFVSDKLTFIPSYDPVSHKIAIVRTMQDNFKWTLIRGKDGIFLFSKQEEFALGWREIRLICTHDGYYLNCWVHASRVGSGVSIIDTRRIVKAINELTRSSTTIGTLS